MGAIPPRPPAIPESRPRYPIPAQLRLSRSSWWAYLLRVGAVGLAIWALYQ